MSGPLIGDATGPQKWTLVSSNENDHLQWMLATIESIDTAADGDWNIWVHPRPGYNYLRFNSDGSASEGLAWDTDRNSNLHMELELHSFPSRDIDFSSHFPVGTLIEARGWWVQDHGHSPWDPKTELHPITCLIAGSLASWSFNVLIAQDTSNRFIPSAWDWGEFLDIPMSIYQGAVDLLAPVQRLPVAILDEFAVVDGMTKSMGWSDEYTLSQWHASETHAETWQRPASIQLYVAMSATGVVQPMYFGQFSRRYPNLLEIDVQRRPLHPTYPGDQPKVLSFDVYVKLLEPGTGLAYSDWSYEHSSTGPMTATTSQTLTGGEHHCRFELTYSPGWGWTDTEWDLRVLASTRPRDWYPGHRTSAAQNGVIPGEGRSFVEGRVRFRLEPSTVQLKVEELREPAEDVDTGPAFAGKCTTAFVIRTTESPIPGVAVTKRGWRVTVLAREDGTMLDAPDVRDVPSTWNAGVGIGYGLTITYRSAQALEVRFVTEWAGEQSGGRYLLVPENRARVLVEAYIETEIGEHVESRTPELHLSGCVVGTYWAQAVNELEQYLVAVLILSARGVPTEPWPFDYLKKNWHAAAATRTGVPRLYGRALPAEARRILDTFKSFSEGRPVSKDALADLRLALKRGADLPESEKLPVPTAKLLSRAPRVRGVNFELRPGFTMILTDLTFSPQGAELRAVSRIGLEGYAASLRRDPSLRAILRYHIRDSQDEAATKQARLNAVSSALVRHGVAAEQVRTQLIKYDPAIAKALGYPKREAIEIHIT